MDGIGAIGMLSAAAARPLSASQAAPVSGNASDQGASQSGATAELSNQFAIGVLGKVMHASADQALSLIQMLSPESAPR